jgi:hypothetical protein
MTTKSKKTAPRPGRNAGAVRESTKVGPVGATGAKRQDKAVAFRSGTVVATFDVKDFCRRYKVVRPDLMRMTGYSLRAVDKWAAGQKPGTAARKQLKELVRLFDALSEIMESGYVGEWLKTANDAFDGSTPLQVIERGETDRIWRMIYLVQTGEPL